MEDLYVNALLHFYEKGLFCLWVMLSFSELEFKWSVYVIDALNQLATCYRYLIFSLFHLKPMIYLFISWLLEV